jgi:hypothetical protein
MAQRIHPTRFNAAPPVDASLGDALTRVADATWRVVANELRMMQFEAREKLGEEMRRMSALVFGTALLVAAWLLALAGVSLIVVDYLPLEQWLLALGALHALAGGLLFVLTRRSKRASAGGRR